MYLPQQLTFKNEFESSAHNLGVRTVLATNDCTGMPAIVKIVPISLFTDEYPIDSFINYQEKLLELRSPFILPYTRIEFKEMSNDSNLEAANNCSNDEKKKFIYLVRDFIDGTPIDQLPRSEFFKLGKNTLFALWKIVVRSFAHMHINSIYPSFLKLSNIFITNEQQIVITDLENPPPKLNLTLTSRNVNNIGLVAPEVFDHRVEPGTAADVWSLGVLLYFMMVTELPWNTRNKFQMVQTMMNGQFDSSKTIPLEIKKLLQRTIIVDPTKRIDVNKLLAAVPDRAKTDSPPVMKKPAISGMKTVNVQDLLKLRKNLPENGKMANLHHSSSAGRVGIKSTLETFQMNEMNKTDGVF